MKTETANSSPAPRKLEKPARDQQEMSREQLVTYAGESEGAGPTTGDFNTTPTFEG